MRFKIIPTQQVHPFDLYYSQTLVAVATSDLSTPPEKVPAKAFEMAKQAWEKREQFLASLEMSDEAKSHSAFKS